MKRIPFVFELRDIWPESIKAVGAMGDSPMIRLLERVEMLLYRKAVRIVSVTESFKRILIERGVEGGKIEVVTNGVDLACFGPREKDAVLSARFGLTGKFVAGYVGTHGMAHALETILDAADRMREIDGGDAYRFILLGNGARKQDLVVAAARMGLTNVVFIDTVPKAEVARYLSLLDVSIIHLKKTELFTNVIPSKLFESMGMGIPVLHGVAGESAAIVEKEGVGLVFEPENAVELCDKMEMLRWDAELYRSFHKNCLAAARRYDRSTLAGRMLNILEGIVVP
jgi:glycosyltransferase involved in cell wall biosynthesis